MQSAAIHAYLINVAETIQHLLLPQLSGAARGSAVDCLKTVTRIAAEMEPLAADGASESSVYEALDERAMQLIKKILDSPPPAGRSFDQTKLEAYLRQHALGGETLRVIKARLLAGGRSKQTILVTQEGARNLPPDLVIRQDWANSVVSSSVYSEFEVLKRLHAAGVRVPQPLLLEPSSAALGAPFIVVTRLAGEVLGDLYTAPPTVGPVLELAEQVGRFHALPADDFASLPGIEERNYTPAQLRVSLASYRTIITKLDTSGSSLVTDALDWLEATGDRVVGPKTLVHGDLGFHNNLCDGDHLSAVLDWELAHVGSPALDLGYLKNAVEDAVAWPEFMARYHAAGGPEISPFVVDWYSLFTNVWFHHMVLQARAGLVSGVLHEMEIAMVCAHFGPAALARISRKMTAALKHYPASSQ